jgi:hypothetical protein
MITNKEKIEAWLKLFGITVYTIHQDGVVDVEGSVDLAVVLGMLSMLPVRFGKVTGYFQCRNGDLTSLEGCPREVGEYFDCSGNQLTSLEGSPTKVGGDFECYRNELTNLKGSPSVVGGDFHCQYNMLKDFTGLETISIGGIIHTTHLDVIIIGGIVHRTAFTVAALNGLHRELWHKVVGVDVLLIEEVQKKSSASIELVTSNNFESDIELI